MRLRPPKRFETARLRLRPPKKADANALFQKYTQDPEVTKYLTWQPHETLQETKDFLERCDDCWQNDLAYTWVMLRKDDRELMGMVETQIHDYIATVGYVLARQYWSRGYMSEALKVITEWAISQPEIFRVWAVCDVENLASARVLEKAGMQREGILRRFMQHPNISEIPRDCFCYALVK